MHKRAKGKGKTSFNTNCNWGMWKQKWLIWRTDLAVVASLIGISNDWWGHWNHIWKRYVWHVPTCWTWVTWTEGWWCGRGWSPLILWRTHWFNNQWMTPLQSASLIHQPKNDSLAVCLTDSPTNEWLPCSLTNQWMTPLQSASWSVEEAVWPSVREFFTLY